MPPFSNKLLTQSAALALALVMMGCQPSMVVTELPPEKQRLQYIVMAYQQATTSLGRPPRNVEELRPFLASFGPPEELLKSPHDQRPYHIYWNAAISSSAPAEMPLIAQETQGLDGEILAVDLQMATHTLSSSSQ